MSPAPVCLATLLHQFGDDAGPASLVAGAESGAIVSVKIFMEEHIVPPMRDRYETSRDAAHGPPAIFVLQENTATCGVTVRRYFP